MATDFVDVSLRGIRREPRDLARPGPVHFVKTTVRLAATPVSPQPAVARPKGDELSVAGGGR